MDRIEYPVSGSTEEADVKWWGWLGVAVLVAGAVLLVWRGMQGDPPLQEDAPPPTVSERLDRSEVLASVALLIGAGLLGAALHRPKDARDGGG
jgi:drug/metabolite transporter (DMT)-like permease